MLDTYPVQICVSTIAMDLICLRHVIVEDNIDSLDVNTTPNQVSGHQQSLSSLLEGAATAQRQFESVWSQGCD